MSRFFVNVPMEVLKQKISELKVLDDYGYPVHGYKLTSTLDKDLSMVEFDEENVVDDPAHWPAAEKLVGYHVAPNGLNYLGVLSGGDWEVPVFHIIYFDGENLRGYIPREGNIFNRSTNTAYGNDEDADLRDFRNRYPEEDLEVDIMYWATGEDLDKKRYNLDLMLEDIQSNITLKP